MTARPPSPVAPRLLTKAEAPKYVIDALSPIPKHWHDHIGNLRVMTLRPVEGYVMVRRPGAAPFTLRVSQLLNADMHTTHGPFTVGRKP